jgi:hypothetical protein
LDIIRRTLYLEVCDVNVVVIDKYEVLSMDCRLEAFLFYCAGELNLGVLCY